MNDRTEDDSTAYPWADARAAVLIVMMMVGMLLMVGTAIGVFLDPDNQRPPPLIAGVLALLAFLECCGCGFLAWSSGRDRRWW